jgi:hypothetical protein
MSKMIVGLAALGLMLASATPGDALWSHPVPSGPTETLMLGWERHFSLEWSVEPTRHQTNRIAGYVINHDGENVDHMRVLAQAVDASGSVIGKRIAWVPGGVNAFGRGYFEIRDLPSADRYRVTVWDYDLIQS